MNTSNTSDTDLTCGSCIYEQRDDGAFSTFWYDAKLRSLFVLRVEVTCHLSRAVSIYMKLLDILDLLTIKVGLWHGFFLEGHYLEENFSFQIFSPGNEICTLKRNRMP